MLAAAVRAKIFLYEERLADLAMPPEDSKE
jgi:hypothetical protein